MCVAVMTLPNPFGPSGPTMHGGTVDRLMFCKLALDSSERFERYGAVGRGISDRTAR